MLGITINVHIIFEVIKFQSYPRRIYLHIYVCIYMKVFPIDVLISSGYVKVYMG